MSTKLKQEVMTKSLIGIQESADQAGCGTNWTAGTNQELSGQKTYKHFPKENNRDVTPPYTRLNMSCL